MGHPLQTGNQTIVSAFQHALWHQMLLIVFLLVVVAIGVYIAHAVAGRETAPATARPPRPGVLDGPEPAARRVLRIGFGIVWVIDGLLQIQRSMPLGLPSGVLQPAAQGSPGWVQHLVNVGATIWSDHPVTAAAATVWIQLAVGLWLLVAPRGRWSRLGGLVSVGWGLVVWVFGEAFGAMLAPGATWLFGAPGAVLIYVVAGALVALPERSWAGPRLGRRLLAGIGIFFIAMAVLQAWPGRGYWQGQTPGHRATGTLTGMVSAMASTSQPHWLSTLLDDFASFDSAHGWGVNLFVVIALAAIGAAFCSGRRVWVRAGTGAALVLCLATWVLVEDLGFLGGLGTDPNSMVPMALLIVGGYVAFTRSPAAQTGQVEVAPVADSGTVAAAAAGVPEPASAPEPVPVGAGSMATAPPDDGARAGGPSDPAAPASTAGRAWLDPSYLVRLGAAAGALAVLLVGVVPMVSASANPNADPILYEAQDGSPNLVDFAAPGFSLVDQHGTPVSLADLRGRTVALTFLDPVCTSDCPVIAQEFRQADQMLGSAGSRAVFVAIVTNPLYHSVAVVDAFDSQEDLGGIANWMYLTGSVPQLEQVWNDYGIQAEVAPAGAMVAHSELTYLIDDQGRVREVLNTDPGSPGAETSSFSVELSQDVHQLLGR